MSNDYYSACPDCVRQLLVMVPGPEALKGAHIHPDPNHEDQKVAHSSMGGVSLGMVVQFTVREDMLRPDAILVDGYGEVLTVADLIAKRGQGKQS